MLGSAVVAPTQLLCHLVVRRTQRSGGCIRLELHVVFIQLGHLTLLSFRLQMGEVV